MTAVLSAPASVATKRIAPHAAPKRAGGRFAFGKYREIIIAVGFFLLFDLGVLVLNFYTSFQIAQDAVGINLSGVAITPGQFAVFLLLLASGGVVLFSLWIVLIALSGWLFLGQTLDIPAIIGLTMIVTGVAVINVFSQAGTHD